MADSPKTACWWCCGGGPADVGPGIFRDFDSDVRGNFPVCLNCGGLGITVDTDDFRVRAHRIGVLRGMLDPGGNPSPSTQLKALLEMREAVVALYREFGEGRECLAKKVADGNLDQAIGSLEQHRAALIAQMRAAPVDPRIPGIVQAREAMVLLLMGEVDQAEAAFRKIVADFPDCSVAHHDYAVFLVEVRQDIAAARPFFEDACRLEPKIALHFVNMGRLLMRLTQSAEAIVYYQNAEACPDFASLDEELRAEVQEAKRALGRMPSA